MSTDRPARVRRNGEGTVGFFKPRGLWRAQYHDATGKRKSDYFRTERDAINHLVTQRAAALAGIPEPVQRHTVASWLPVWLETLAAPRLRPQSRRRYASLVAAWCAEPVSRIELVKLQPEHVGAAMARLERAGRSASHRAYMHRLLATALEAAMRSRHVSRNVARDIDPPAVERRAAIVLRGEDHARLVAAMAADDLEALWLVGYSAGLRIGESLGLRWGDVDLVNRTLAVRGSLVQDTGELGPTKSAAGRRTIRIAPDVARALTRHFARSMAGLAAHPDRPVFAFHRGRSGRIHPDAVQDRLHAVCRRAGVPELRYHDLRHACATRLAEHGTTPTKLAEYLGHSTWRMSERYYHGPEIAGLEPPELVAELEPAAVSR